MRVVEPKHFKSIKTRRKKRTRLNLLLFVFVVLTAFGAYLYTESKQLGSSPQSTRQEDAKQPEKAKEQKMAQTEFRQFSGQEFKDLYLTVSYPNIQEVEEPPVITGNKAADDRIMQLAEARGYRMTSIPVAPITKINEPRLDSDDLLQPLAAAGWIKLKTSAQKDKVPLALLSGYRSLEYQRKLFLGRLYAKSVTADQIAKGEADVAVSEVLTLAAVPGYSRHHTGYTIDLWCEDGNGTFLASSCFKWISANNYLKAKEAGWIPSYPEGTDMQGPEPEPWEYVWVGQKSLLKE